MSLFSQPSATDRSHWYPHGQLSLSLFRVDSVFSPCVAKMGIQSADTTISANSHPLRMPLAVNIHSSLLSIQPWYWNSQIISLTAVARAGRMLMVPSFRSIDISRARLQPQSCMRAQHAQLNPQLQWPYPHPYHVKKHTGSITATTSSSMGLLCTQVCSYPTKDSDRAVCYSIATSLLDHTVLSSIRSSSLMWLQSIKPSVGSSERVAAICRSVWSCVSASMFCLWCDPTSPGEARLSSACAGGYAQNLGRASGIATPSSFDSPVTMTASLDSLGVHTNHCWIITQRTAPADDCTVEKQFAK